MQSPWRNGSAQYDREQGIHNNPLSGKFRLHSLTTVVCLLCRSSQSVTVSKSLADLYWHTRLFACPPAGGTWRFPHKLFKGPRSSPCTTDCAPGSSCHLFKFYISPVMVTFGEDSGDPEVKYRDLWFWTHCLHLTVSPDGCLGRPREARGALLTVTPGTLKTILTLNGPHSIKPSSQPRLKLGAAAPSDQQSTHKIPYLPPCGLAGFTSLVLPAWLEGLVTAVKVACPTRSLPDEEWL